MTKYGYYSVVVLAVVVVIVTLIVRVANVYESEAHDKYRSWRNARTITHTVVENQAPAVIEGCPTEDSCRIDYHDGTWYVTPQVP